MVSHVSPHVSFLKLLNPLSRVSQKLKVAESNYPPFVELEVSRLHEPATDSRSETDKSRSIFVTSTLIFTSYLRFGVSNYYFSSFLQAQFIFYVFR